MIPPIVRRCPECSHIGLGWRFASVECDDRQRVECPSCHHRFETVDNPLLN